MIVYGIDVCAYIDVYGDDDGDVTAQSLPTRVLHTHTRTNTLTRPPPAHPHTRTRTHTP
jgi:hypothetical protein